MNKGFKAAKREYAAPIRKVALPPMGGLISKPRFFGADSLLLAIKLMLPVGIDESHAPTCVNLKKGYYDKKEWAAQN